MTADQILKEKLGHLVRSNNGIERIYPLIARENADKTKPYIVYNPAVSSNPENTLDGYTGHENVRVQIDVYDETFTKCKNLAAQIVWILNEIPTSEFISNIPMPETSPSLYRRMVEFYLWQTT